MPQNMIKQFLKLESASGILLCGAAILALVFENSIFKGLYQSILTTKMAFIIGGFELGKPVLLWINDGFMAIFFLLVGLEIKREVLEGQLSNREQISLPAMAAFGGILGPSLLYTYFNFGDSEALRGWAIPAATDIAFALAIVMVLGNRVSQQLKVCLLAIAIIDDLAAIIIIAVFYTESLSYLSMAFSMVFILGLILLNLRGVDRLAPYVVLGILLWVCVLKSGVHATLAGVVLAFCIPLNTPSGNQPLRVLEHDLHPWVAFAILPLFAFANAGVSLEGITLDVLMNPITLGIIAGLFLGKQIGVMAMTALGVLFKICKLPTQVSWVQFYGMACITGVGFTMSLFIGTLAFDSYEHQTAVRLGVIVGSLLSGGLGYLVFILFPNKTMVQSESSESL